MFGPSGTSTASTSTFTPYAERGRGRSIYASGGGAGGDTGAVGVGRESLTAGRLRRGRRHLLLSVRARPLRHTGSTGTFRRRRARWCGTRRSMRCRWRTIPFQFAASPAAARAARADTPPDVVGHGGIAQQVGFSSLLPFVFAWSSILTMVFLFFAGPLLLPTRVVARLVRVDSSSDSHSRQNGQARTVSHSLNSDSCSSDDDGGLDGDEEMADVEGEGVADGWEGGESDEDDDDDASARSDDGRGAGVQCALRGSTQNAGRRACWRRARGGKRTSGTRARRRGGRACGVWARRRRRCRWCPPWRAGTGAGTRAGTTTFRTILPSSHPQQLAPHQQFLQSSQQNGFGLVLPMHHSVMPSQNYGGPAR
ncbi:hypothetical protein C8F04DRAFT_1114127 [Mycena alexandri]|uniref:Uncharacterized protein n=1 Tax=Mycena alexandri TaxID=1745969 RepID=A0AAD6WYR2_9AGAR|nr:hypothetical protein C8F04DRAFT_1114127 [Mycena alexandri]